MGTVTVPETTTSEKTLGPLLIRLRDYDGPHCTACGSSMTAVAFVTTKGADAALCCDGCGRRGVFCGCVPVPGHHGIER